MWRYSKNAKKRVVLHFCSLVRWGDSYYQITSCRIYAKPMTKTIDWLVEAFKRVARCTHSCCLCFDRGYVSKSRIRNTNCKGTHRGQHLFHPMFAFSAHVSEPKKACFQDLRNSKFFCGFAIFTNFVKMWKSNFFLFFLNSLNSENPTFFWISWFPMVGPKPTDTGPKGFLNFCVCKSLCV